MTVRQKVADQKRVLDEVSRRRRQRKALEALESDNFSEDPHADLKMSKKAPKFEEAMDVTGKGTVFVRELALDLGSLCYLFTSLARKLTC